MGKFELPTGHLQSAAKPKDLGLNAESRVPNLYCKRGSNDYAILPLSYFSIWIESKPIVSDSSCSITDNSD